jgi:hypothetical protein
LVRYARVLGNNVHDVVFRHEGFLFVAMLSPCGHGLFVSFLGILFLVAESGGLFEILGLDRCLFIGLDDIDLAFLVLEGLGDHGGRDTGTGA